MNNQSTYKRLGNYIREVDVRNKDLKVTNLLGLSMTKQFRSSTSNIVGVDLSKYKIVDKNTFAFDTMSVIRVHKVPIAINLSDKPIIVSPAYITFECKDFNQLNPKYLMMWFSRSEFDRYADFKSDANVRGGYNWDELCDTLIYLPPIERQREIVAQYETLSRRIAINRNLIARLETTAQTLYRHMFVDGIDKENLPQGWKIGTILDLGNVITGKTPSSDHPEDFGSDMPFITPGDFNSYNKFIINSERHISTIGYKRLQNKILPIGSVLITCIGSDMGKVAIASEQCITNQQINSIVVSEDFYSSYLYHLLSVMRVELRSMALGSSTMPLLNKSDFEKIEIIVPPNKYLYDFNKKVSLIDKLLILYSKEIYKLTELQSLLLAKMGQ